MFHAIANFFRITAEVAAFQGLFVMKLNGVFDVLLLLANGIDGIVSAAGNDGVAADDPALFNNNHIGSGIMGFNRCGQPGITRADNDDIHETVPLFRYFHGSERLREEHVASQGAGRCHDAGAGHEMPPTYPMSMVFVMIDGG